MVDNQIMQAEPEWPEPQGEATPDQPEPLATTGQRLASLDFIRGIAVMGILAANILAFGQPLIATIYPGAMLVPHSAAEDGMWVAQFILIDGKMRGLFTLLFGAGLLLFLDKAWAKGATIWLQIRRLFWLAIIGLIHFIFIWRGDILLLYACSGLIALLFVSLKRRNMLILGVIGYIGGAILFTGVFGFLHFAADPVTADNPVFSELSAELATEEALQLVEARHEAEMIAAGHHGEWVAKNISVYLPEQFSSLLMYGFETVPLILIGMALYRYGVFDGTADGTRLRRWGWIMVVGGTVLSVPIALWALDDGLSYYGTLAAVAGYGSLPRLPVIVGLAFLLSLWGAHAHGWLGQRISAAGRAAFTNYLGTSMVMMLIFWGWAGGLYGKLTRSELYLVMLLGWAVMLLWSKPWLDRFRYGPLEWVWRCLTYGRLFPLRR